MTSIEEQLILHEGLKLKPYRCTAGKLTIGVGRNLDDKGISKEEALFLLANDIEDAIKDLSNFDWFEGLDPVRKKVVIDMRYNLGPTRFREFRRMIAALAAGDYKAAAAEMVNSKWYYQVGTRARRLMEMMRTGEDYGK